MLHADNIPTVRLEVRTVKLLIRPGLEDGQIDDGLSALLSGDERSESGVLQDWSYVRGLRQYVEVPADYHEGDFLSEVGL